MFSARLPSALAPNALATAVAAHRAAGRPVLDLTQTNPTEVGLSYPPDVLRSLGDEAGVRYRPDPRGLADARAAVAERYAPGATVDPEAVLLTCSTSEAYGLIFKLLCDPDTDVLVPQPSYPLFDLLTRLEGVAPRAYRLEYDGRWTIDRASLEQAAGERTRAVLVVSPNNPTGSWLREDDREWLVALARRRGFAIVSDEVFADYPLSVRPGACSLAAERRALTFVLGGLSKSAGLPQVKLGWIAASGPDALVHEAMARLEVISDTYLSVSTPVQLAARRLMADGAAIRRAIHARVRHNLDRLREEASRYPAVALLEPEGGWSAVVRVPATITEEAMVLGALDQADVLVHPGFFFDFPQEAYLAMSLLPEPGTFSEAVRRLLAFVAGAAA